MEEKTLQEKLDEMDYRATCKRFCDDIDQRLEKVTFNMAGRAIWELFQNAGDVAHSYDGGKKAYIKLTLTPTEFVFSHKGKPFTYDTLNSLVKQVSSQSKEEDTDAVGQYGTGFVTTHSFGKLLSISGSMEKPFEAGTYIDIDNFIIDRFYQEKQEFYEKMPRQLAQVKKLALSTLTTPIVREWTELRYDLSTAIGGNGVEKASRGFEAAVKTMPYLMTINHVIAEVEIENQLTGLHVKFTSRQLEDESGLKVMQIKTESNGVEEYHKVYFITSANSEDVIILPFASPTTARRLDDMAKLFVYYPLVGSENFGFEFIFHSRRFIPEEERNGVYLPKQEANSPQKYENNVAVLNEMSDMLFAKLRELEFTFSDWDKILNLNLYAPDGSDSIRRTFFKNLRQKWVAFYESLRVIEVNGERRSISGNKVRLYSADIVKSLSTNESDYTNDVYNAAKCLNDIPSKEAILKWSQVVATWYDDQTSYFLSTEDIAKKLSEEEKDIEVLYGFDRYIKAISQTQLFDRYALIPNRDGMLRTKVELRNAQTIPTWISSLAMPFVSDDVKRFVDERFIEIDNYSSYTRGDLRKALNDALETKAKETFRKNVNPMRCDDATLRALAMLSLIFSTESNTSVRATAMKVIAKYMGIPYEEKVLPKLDSEEKELAYLPFKHLVENLLFEISTKEKEWIKKNSDYILALHQSLHGWSVYYNRNDKKGLATDYGCFPNMQSSPSMASGLRYGIDIPKEIFDIYERIIGKDLRSSLVAPEYGDFYEFVKVNANGVAKEIEDTLADEGYENEVVLDIIEYVDNDVRWAALFPRIAEKKAELFMKQVRPECKEGVFRLMKIDDADRLNQLADLADEFDMDEILRLGKKAVLRSKNDKADFEYKMALGKYVEDFVLDQVRQKINTSFPDTGIKVEVADLQGGQDIVIFCNNTPVYYLEVKSRWGTNRSVEMSHMQLHRCVEEASRYALLCLNMTDVDRANVEEHVYPPIEETISKIKAITNIGILAREARNAVEISEEKVHLGGGYSCVVPQIVIEREGRSFNQLMDSIISQCLTANVN